jgi:hypothetical protein
MGYVHTHTHTHTHIYIVDCMRCWILMIEIRIEIKGPCDDGWLSNLIVVDNLGCSKYKRNSA